MTTKQPLWPVPTDIKGIVGDSFDKLLTGWLFHLSISIGRPVVFVYRTADGKIAYKEELREYEKISPLCSKFREDVTRAEGCREQDKEYAQLSLDYHSGHKRSSKLSPDTYILADGQEVKYDTYKCKRLELIEWMVPVVINKCWYGVFITGQFVNPGDEDKVRQKLIDCSLESLSEKVSCHLPDDNQKESFFSQIRDFAKYLENQIEAKKIMPMQKFFEDMRPYLLGYVYPSTLHKKTWEDEPVKDFMQLTERFRENRTNLYEALIVFRNNFALKDLHIFKARSKVDYLSKQSDLYGSELAEENLVGDHVNNRTRDFPLCPHRILYSSLMEYIDEESKGETMIRVVIQEADRIKALMVNYDNSELPDFTNALLLSYANIRYENYPVVYVLFFHDTQAKESYISALKTYDVLNQVSALYFTNWYAIYADYHRYTSGIMTIFTKHELGNTLAGMKVDLEKLEENYIKLLQANPERTKKIRELFDALDEHIELMDEYIPNAWRYSDLLSLISGMTDSAVLTRKPELSRFYPNWLLNKMVNTFKPMFKDSNKRIVGPNVISDSLTHTPINVDQKLFELITNNLINNALKYAHENTSTYADCYLDPDRKRYRLTVVSYGAPIIEEDYKNIFEIGYRTEEAKAIGNGMGMGLYLVKCFAGLHKGSCAVISKTICEYHAAYLRMLMMKEIYEKAQFGREEMAIYRAAHDKVNHDYPNDYLRLLFRGKNIASMRMIEQFLKSPTARNEFIVEFPQEH